MGFLSPYRVLDLTNERGLLAGKMFADLGADVIQVEPVGGSSARHIGPFIEDGPVGEQSLYWDAYACNKRGITCNLDSKEGQNLFRQLCLSADFLFESEAPGVMHARELSFDALHAINPRLIYTTITPFGSTGPKADYADSEIIVWAAGTAVYPHRDGDRPPLRISVPQAHLHAAADAAGGALVAHFARLGSGMGQHVDISAQQSVGQATLSAILGAAVGDRSYEKGAQGTIRKNIIDQSGSGSALKRSKWIVQDGYLELHLTMGPSAGRFTNALMVWLHDEGAIDTATAQLDWIRMPEYLASGAVTFDELDRIYERVATFLRTRTKKDLMEVAIGRKLLMAPISTTKDLAESPHLAAREFWRDVESSDGRRRRLPGPFARTTCDAFTFARAAPRLGEQNQEVYADLLNLTQEDITTLTRQGVL